MDGAGLERAQQAVLLQPRGGGHGRVDDVQDEAGGVQEAGGELNINFFNTYFTHK